MEKFHRGVDLGKTKLISMIICTYANGLRFVWMTLRVIVYRQLSIANLDELQTLISLVTDNKAYNQNNEL